jgi:NAD(P)-dependent dehydrogenase (short-subunit alcohol dehydrogenase family)
MTTPEGAKGIARRAVVVPDALAGQVAIVTGGASGIGLATCLQLGGAGATVAIFGRGEAAGAEAVEELRRRGAPAMFVGVDLANVDAIAPAVQSVIHEFGKVDILVNNAATRGIGDPSGRTGLFEIEPENWDFVHAVNLRAPLLLVQEVGRHLVERGEGGRIVNVTSTAAFMTRNCSAHYASSKAALTSLTRTAAAELGPHGVTVNAVAPGLTRTPYRQVRLGSDEAFQRVVSSGPMENLTHSVAEPDDVAAAIVFLCLPASGQITGQTIHTSGGFIA